MPETARLVVVTGPNGCGKSSLFDAFKTWQSIQGFGGPSIEPLYHYKQNQIMPNHNELSTIAFHEPLPSDITDRKKMFYIRSAYRNQSDFMTAQLQRMGALVDAPQAAKMIDNEAAVSDNYLRLVSASVESMYSGSYDELLVRDLRDQYIGQVRESMRRIFDGVLALPTKCLLPTKSGGAGRFDYKVARDKGTLGGLADAAPAHEPPRLPRRGLCRADGGEGTMPAPVLLVRGSLLSVAALAMRA